MINTRYFLPEVTVVVELPVTPSSSEEPPPYSVVPSSVTVVVPDPIQKSPVEVDESGPVWSAWRGTRTVDPCLEDVDLFNKGH